MSVSFRDTPRSEWNRDTCMDAVRDDPRHLRDAPESLNTHWWVSCGDVVADLSDLARGGKLTQPPGVYITL